MSIARHSFFTTLTQILVQVFGILSGIIMARMLGPEGRGVYALYYTNAQLLFTFCSLSFNIALVYFIPAGKFSPEKMLGLSFIVNAFSSVISLVIILASYFSELKTLMFPENYMGVVFLGWLIFHTITLFFSSTYISFFQATRRFPQLNRLNLFISTFSLLCFLFLWLARDIIPTRVGLFLLILLVSQVFSMAIFARTLHIKLKIKPSFRFNWRQDFKELKGFIIAAHLSIVANFFNYRFSTWAIHYYINETALGLYSLAINSGSIFFLISEPLSMVLTPYLSAKEGLDKKIMFYTYFRIFFWVLFIIAIITLLLAPVLFPWVYGAEFEASVFLFQLAIPGFILAAMTKILATFVISSGKQKYNLYATLVGLSVAITANLFLVQHWFERGAVFANLMTYGSIFISLLFLCNTKLKLNIPKLFFITLSDIQLLKEGFRKVIHR